MVVPILGNPELLTLERNVSGAPAGSQQGDVLDTLCVMSFVLTETS